MQIRNMNPEDWLEVSRIYAEGMATGMATFETETPAYRAWDKAHLKSCRLVAVNPSKIVGWAALSPVSSRCVYGGVAEVSIYVAHQYRSIGVGLELLKELIQQSEVAGIWTLQAGIFPENSGSIKLHEKAGFRLVGCREKIGNLNGLWKDNLLYEKRSKRIGVE